MLRTMYLRDQKKREKGRAGVRSRPLNVSSLESRPSFRSIAFRRGSVGCVVGLAWTPSVATDCRVARRRRRRSSDRERALNERSPAPSATARATRRHNATPPERERDGTKKESARKRKRGSSTYLLTALSFGTRQPDVSHLTRLTCPLAPAGLFLPECLLFFTMALSILSQRPDLFFLYLCPARRGRRRRPLLAGGEN